MNVKLSLCQKRTFIGKINRSNGDVEPWIWILTQWHMMIDGLLKKMSKVKLQSGTIDEVVSYREQLCRPLSADKSNLDSFLSSPEFSQLPWWLWLSLLIGKISSESKLQFQLWANLDNSLHRPETLVCWSRSLRSSAWSSRAQAWICRTCRGSVQ